MIDSPYGQISEEVWNSLSESEQAWVKFVQAKQQAKERGE